MMSGWAALKRTNTHRVPSRRMGTVIYRRTHCVWCVCVCACVCVTDTEREREIEKERNASKGDRREQGAEERGGGL